MMYSENLEELIINRHSSADCDEIIIISGYISSSSVRKIKSKHIRTTIVYGMYAEEGITLEEHRLLQKLKDSLGDTIVCDELVKAIEGVTTNGKTKLQQG